MSNNNKGTVCNVKDFKNKKIKATRNVGDKALPLETLSLVGGDGIGKGASEPIFDGNVNTNPLLRDESDKSVPTVANVSAEGFSFNVRNSENAEDPSWLAMKMCNNNLLSTPGDVPITNFQSQRESSNNWWDRSTDRTGAQQISEQATKAESKELTASFGSGQKKEFSSLFKNPEEDEMQNACGSSRELDLDYEVAMAVGAVHGNYSPPNNSNHTSLNNSTENLSYEDMLLLENDAVESEVSINSDDCVYAYRGNADELEFAILENRRVNNRPDDENEFLEMDYEPDPLSEVEYADSVSNRGELHQAHTNALLLQRDSCHIHSNGRHIAIVEPLQTPTVAQHHLNSPSDDLPATNNTLQSQALLGKSFARISLHLDQINNENDYESDSLNTNGRTNDNNLTAATALSLPSTLNSYDDEAANNDEASHEYAKVTGAKPKRLSRFSSTSSTSSKTSTKSRNSLKSSLTPAALVVGSSTGNGAKTSAISFDERSVSCNDFRSAPLTSHGKSYQHKSNDNFTDQSSNDDSCLDCLEKEFLANTIGKKEDSDSPASSSKCDKHKDQQNQHNISSSSSCSNNNNNHSSSNSKNNSNQSLNRKNYRQPPSHYRSNSPAYYMEYDYPRDEYYFDEYSPYTCVQYIGPERNIYAFDDEIDINFEPFRIGSIEHGAINQRRKKKRDNMKKEEMLKNFSMTDSEIKISTLNLSEEVLVQALDQLQISYSAALIKMYFKNQMALYAPQSSRNFKNIYQFLMCESKKPCNLPKIKRLIESATKQQVEVEFQKDPDITEQEMVPVRVYDILLQWAKNRNLDVLKHFDERFMEANVIGKIGNLIRQAQTHRSSRRSMPEFIKIPQFYPSGFLIIKKKQ